MSSGWHHESARHSLAAKGIKSPSDITGLKGVTYIKMPEGSDHYYTPFGSEHGEIGYTHGENIGWGQYEINKSMVHELGHWARYHLTFKENLIESPKKPSYKIAQEYMGGNSDEGWACSYADYFYDKEYLAEESPELYEYWDDVMRLNPDLYNYTLKLMENGL